MERRQTSLYDSNLLFPKWEVVGSKFQGQGFFSLQILKNRIFWIENQQKRLRSKVFECGCVGVTCFYVSVSETERRKCYMGGKKKRRRKQKLKNKKKN